MTASVEYDFTAPREKIRDATKWLIGASAAIGAALIAGSQLSGIGALTLCGVGGTPWSWSVPCLRLPAALIGAVVALAAVAVMIWSSVRLLIPVGIPMDALCQAWGQTKPPPEVQFFLDNPKVMSRSTPEEVLAERDRSASYVTEVTNNAASNRRNIKESERELAVLEAVRDGTLDAAELPDGLLDDLGLETATEVRRLTAELPAARAAATSAEGRLEILQRQAGRAPGAFSAHITAAETAYVAQQVDARHRALTELRVDLRRARRVHADALNDVLAVTRSTLERRRARQMEYDDALPRATAALNSWEGEVTKITDIAQYQVLLAGFRRLTVLLILGAAATALGITLYAWASNPGSAGGADLRNVKLIDAQLQGADLTSAQLDGADLSGADLSGAVLDGASLRSVRWAGTTCPDGTNSDEVTSGAQTCFGHLGR